MAGNKKETKSVPELQTVRLEGNKKRYFVRIDGGIGRCLTATGAVKQFAEQHKNDEVNIVTGIPFCFEGLQGIERIYPIGTPFLYEDNIKKGDYLEPEPYNDSAYYLEEKHIATVFNKLLNGKEEFIQPILNLSENEKVIGKATVEQEEKKTEKKMILIQPWGSSGGRVVQEKDKEATAMIDESYRSFGIEFTKKLCAKLVEEGYIPYMVKTNDQLGFKECMGFDSNQVYPRQIMSMIPYVKGIISCDSFLAHASAALGTPVPTVVLWAGTSSKNLGYKEHLNIESWKKTEQEPNRIPHDHAYYVNKNKGSNEFKLEEINKIIKHLKGGN